MFDYVGKQQCGRESSNSNGIFKARLSLHRGLGMGAFAGVLPVLGWE